MKSNFTDKNMILTYLQIKLKERYNPNTIINSEYYKNIYNNYGFAHMVAKYLNAMYPPMDSSYDINNADDVFNTIKQPTDCISILNYFLCSNDGQRINLDDVYDNDLPENKSIYKQIYSTDICALFNIFDAPLQMTYDKLFATDPETTEYLIQSAYIKALKSKIDHQGLDFKTNMNDIANSERCYFLFNWSTPKEICEIDNFILSYLLGKTITPYSSREDIYYVQQLMINSNTIANKDRGIWNSDSGNLTDIIMNYQRLKVDTNSSDPIFVTGYFDIYTEAAILKDRGEKIYGIRGL